MAYIEQETELVQIEDNGNYVNYPYAQKRRKWDNPEEKVQAEVYTKLIREYKYPVNRVRMYETVTMGSSKREADIIVYADDECKQPYIVVECKKEETSEAEFLQAIEQAFSYSSVYPTAKYVWVTNRIKNRYFEYAPDRPKERITNQLPNIPKFGSSHIPPYRYVKKPTDPQFDDITVVSESDLTRRFKQAHDALWAGGELNPSQAFDELDKLIFCKVWDEKTTEKGHPYKFQLFKNEAPEKLAERIQLLYKKGQESDPEVFNKPLDLTPIRVQTVVTYLQDINFSDTDLDSKGRAFESFVGTYFRGEFGQYFTPRSVVKMIVDVLPITNTSRVLDTSCGSGGFLLYALDKVRKQADAKFDLNDTKEAVLHYRHWHDFAEKNLYGIEINEQISRVAKMNMILHDDGHTNVVSADGLLYIDDIRAKTKNQGFAENSFDFIITNPPFGSIIRQSEKAYMQVDGTTAPYYNFALKEINWIDKQLNKHRATGRENQSTEVLFIEQCWRFLKPGGYLAMVIPDGILTNSSMQYVRNRIELMYRLVGVVSLPQTAFTHTGAGVKSSVLFLRKHDAAQTSELEKLIDRVEARIAEDMKLPLQHKRFEEERKELTRQKRQFEAQKSAEDPAPALEDLKDRSERYYEELDEARVERLRRERPDYPVFMAIAENIGYDATGKPINQNDLPEITAALSQFIQEIETAF